MCGGGYQLTDHTACGSKLRFGFVEVGADTRQQLLRYNALHASAALRRSDIARFLLEAGADVNALTQVVTSEQLVTN